MAWQKMAENVSVLKISRKQQNAIAALLCSKSVGDAAKQAGVSERQLHRWLAESPAFRAELQRCSDEAMTTAVRLLSDTSRIAVMTLRQVLENRKASPADRLRVRAAAVVLSHVLQLKELAELQERVRVLENAHNGKGI